MQLLVSQAGRAIGDPKRMMFPSGSMSTPSCCPHSVSCGGLTSAPADVNRSAN
jgi:hypothetical protein